MADIKQLEAALVKADAAGNVDDARALANEIRRMRAASTATPTDNSVIDDIKQGAGNLGVGVARGVKDVIDTGAQLLSSGFDKIAGTKEGERVRAMNKAGTDEFKRDYGGSAYADVGRIAGNIAATLPVGGAIGGLVGGIAKAAPIAQPILNPLASAISTGGFRTGAMQGGVQNMLTRAAGGAITGGASAGLVNPGDAGMGAAIGGSLPPVLSGIGRVAGYAGKGAGSIIKPFTASGQDEIAGNIIRNFAEGGPIRIDARQIVPGSQPTLAEATGNAGLATLQRGTRDLRPNAFAEREALNSAARSAAFDNVAGDVGKLDFFKAERSNVGGELYKQALSADVAENITPYVKGQITQLLKRPSINDASKLAQRLARERGEKPAAMGSLPALHDVKTVIDDKISEAVRRGAGGEAKALQATKDKLLDVMEKLSPDYAAARQTYAEMSKPINAMEVLQGLKLTDAQGNMTLAKVQSALSSVEKAANSAGANPAKSISAEQLETLRAIRDDLLRQSNLGKGKSIGSNTFQNIATDNILNSLAGNTLSRLADRVGVSGAVGQVGRLAYSGPNEAIRNRLADMMLQPELANAALNPAPQLRNNALARFLENSSAPVYRAAPLLGSGQ